MVVRKETVVKFLRTNRPKLSAGACQCILAGASLIVDGPNMILIVPERIGERDRREIEKLVKKLNKVFIPIFYPSIGSMTPLERDIMMDNGIYGGVVDVVSHPAKLPWFIDIP